VGRISKTYCRLRVRDVASHQHPPQAQNLNAKLRTSMCGHSLVPKLVKHGFKVVDYTSSQRPVSSSWVCKEFERN